MVETRERQTSLDLRNQATFLEEVEQQLIEAGRVFEAACVAGTRQNLVHRSRYEARREFSAGSRMIELAVDDQKRRFHLR